MWSYSNVPVSAFSGNSETSGWIPVQEHRGTIVNATSVLSAFPFLTVTVVSVTIWETTALIYAFGFVQIFEKCTNWYTLFLQDTKRHVRLQ